MDWTFHPTLVEPFYLLVMNANVLSETEAKQAEFMKSLGQAAASVTDDELLEMLRSSWRPAKVAAWLIAIGKREQFVPHLEAMLLVRPDHAEHVCIALAALHAISSVDALQRYVDFCAEGKFAPGDELGERLSPDWAVAAIEHIGDASAALRAGSGWTAFLAAQQHAIPRLLVERGVGHRLREASEARLMDAKNLLALALTLLNRA